MSHAKVLPVRFDPQLLAYHDSELIGSVSAEAMTRMKNTVVSMDPMVAVNLQFSCGSYGLARVTGRIQHTVGLRCQRCLDATQISLDQAIEVLLKPESEQVSQIAERHEFYEYDGKSLELAEFIEDELLLGLPLVPKHEDISLCNQGMIAWLASNEVPAENAENPFAIQKR